MRKYYLPVRALHLYIGLLISPFVLIFAVSVLVINHPQFINKAIPLKEIQANVRLDSVPLRSTDLLTARAILKELNITAEVEYINRNDSSLFFPARTPGKQYRISVNTHNGMASVTETDLGALRGTAFMHYMPGPHNASIRGNSGFIKVWRYIADLTVYSILFLTISGIFLWFFIKSERKAGIYATAAGVLVLIGLILFSF
jgi:hypothetical protein